MLLIEKLKQELPQIWLVSYPNASYVNVLSNYVNKKKKSELRLTHMESISENNISLHHTLVSYKHKVEKYWASIAIWGEKKI